VAARRRPFRESPELSESYSDQQRRTFEGLIEDATLDERQRQFLRLRWLDQLLWMEGKAKKAQWFYYRVRLVTIIGAVIVPGLVPLSTLDGRPGRAAQIATWIVSLVVAISAAIEGFFQFGQRWRNYRSTAERLKIEGWLFFQRAGPYESTEEKQIDAFGLFVTRVEELLQKEVEAYITDVATEKQGASGSK
jgi:Protein of unknown function (DUF4231)